MNTNMEYQQLDQQRQELTSLIEQKQARHDQLTVEIDRAKAVREYARTRPLQEERAQLSIEKFRASDARDTVVRALIERFGTDEQRAKLRASDSRPRTGGPGASRVADFW